MINYICDKCNYSEQMSDHLQRVPFNGTMRHLCADCYNEIKPHLDTIQNKAFKETDTQIGVFLGLIIKEEKDV